MIKWTGFEFLKAELPRIFCSTEIVEDIIHTIERETASDSLHDFRGWKKVVKNLGAYDFKLLYK